MKKAIGIIMIIIGVVFEAMLIWTLATMGGNRIGAAVMFLLGLLVIILGNKLRKA